MIDREKVILALERKRSQFEGYSAEQERQRALIQERLAAFLLHDCRSLSAYLEKAGITWPGALPTSELDQADHLCMAFGHLWQDHQAARAWALDVVQGHPVVAVDGSQITPTKDLSVPVGAVQIGWYINYHRSGGEYVKDIEFEVLAPDELDAEGDSESEHGFPDWRVNLERFRRECDKLCQLMTDFAAVADEEKPLCLFDGSFIVSFAGQMRPERARLYTQAVERLLDCSEHYRVPLVAFVDTSFSRDFVTLADLLVGGSGELSLSDAALLGQVLPSWGDRSPFFICARNDALSQDGRASFYQNVVFSYVRLAAERTPARVEMPRWLLEEGRAEPVLDLVRAQCVVGTGYPYAIETADALAVISQQDRKRFYALFEQFAAQAGLHLTQARKAASKRVRR